MTNSHSPFGLSRNHFINDDERLLERDRKRGDGARMLVPGRRSLCNQVKLGVLSKKTLQLIVEKGGPELLPELILLYGTKREYY